MIYETSRVGDEPQTNPAGVEKSEQQLVNDCFDMNPGGIEKWQTRESSFAQK